MTLPPSRSSRSTEPRVVTVGTGTCVPRLERRGPCTLIEAAGLRCVVDLGLGALHGLLEAGVSHQQVDALFLTHLHPDHVCELAPFLFAANYDEVPRRASLDVVGGPGVAGFVSALSDVYGHWLHPKGYELHCHELAGGDYWLTGSVRVHTAAAEHEESSLAYRFEVGGWTAVITGDTGPSGSVEALARGADLLLAEASRAEGQESPGHLTPRQAGTLARRAGVGRVALHHLYPASDAGDPVRWAAEGFDGEVILARDGMEVWGGSPGFRAQGESPDTGPRPVGGRRRRDSR